MSSADTRFFGRENFKLTEPFRNRIVGRNKILGGLYIFPIFIPKQNYGVFETFMCLACYGGLWKWVKFPSWMKNFSLLRGIHLLLA